MFKIWLKSSSIFINILKIYSKIINILGGGGLEYELEKNFLFVLFFEWGKGWSYGMLNFF